VPITGPESGPPITFREISSSSVQRNALEALAQAVLDGRVSLCGDREGDYEHRYRVIVDPDIRPSLGR
jgi:hypothetical protein